MNRKKSPFIFLSIWLPLLGGGLLLAAFSRAVSVRGAPATIYTVVNFNDVGTGSLRQAISAASAGDTIDFNVSGTILLASELIITKSLTIKSDQPITISGNHTTRVFNVLAGNVIFDGLTIANGNVKTSDCPLSNQCGGGIMIQNGGVGVTVTNSTLVGNSAGLGGGIYAYQGRVAVTNSTLSANSADFGGGIHNNGGQVAISYSTLTANLAGTGAGGIAGFGDSFTLTTITSTIVSGNVLSSTTTPDDLALYNGVTDSFVSGDYNLLGAIGDSITAFAATNDQTGIFNPGLSPLADHGGRTLTHLPLPASPSIDWGDPGFTPPPFTDQRGVSRALNGRIDIGAVEACVDVTIAVTNGDQGPGSLRQAVIDVCGGGVVRFDNSLSQQTIGLASELAIAKDITISGTIPITISGNHATRIFNVIAGNVTFDSLTIANGTVKTTDCPFNDQCGGGIMVQNGSVTVTDSTLSGNSAAYGGGLYNYQGTVTVTQSTLFSNSAGALGGGLFNYSGGMLTLTHSTLSGNSAAYGGAVFNYHNGTVNIAHSTLTTNLAGVKGGGVASVGTSTTLTALHNSIVAGNGRNAITTPDDVALSFGTIDSYTSGDYNLIGAIEASITTFAATNDQTGIFNPGLAALSDNGGLTLTHLPLPGSPAIDRGDPGFTPPPFTDQRGIWRVQNGRIDVGSVERLPAPGPLTLSITRLSATDGELTWENPIAGCQSDVFEATTPYVLPAVATYPAVMAPYFLPSRLGDVATNYFYLTRITCDGVSTDSNRVGAFDIAFFPGE